MAIDAAEAPITPGRPPAATDNLDAAATRATLVTAFALGLSSMAFNVWWPFLTLYVLELGAKSDANAQFWVFILISIQAVTRLVTSPIWGIMSDRMGRKMMFLRTLYFSSLTFVVAAVVQSPLQLGIALALQGIFSGSVGPAIALTSVSVPESRLNSSISTVNAAQYIGTTIGPAIGGVAAIAFGFRGSILVAAVLPLIAGVAVHVFVPRDFVARNGTGEKGKATQLEPFKVTFQFALVIFLFLVLFATNQLVRLVTPLDLKVITGESDVKAISSVAFSLSGAASALSVIFLGPRLFKSGRMARALGASFLAAAGAAALLAFAQSSVLYIAGFLLMAVMLSAMVPATNALIAGNVSRARRGTAFGIAASAQAVALSLGPGAAALFAAFSYDQGFLILGATMLLIGLLLLVKLREPQPAAAASS